MTVWMFAMSVFVLPSDGLVPYLVCTLQIVRDWTLDIACNHVDIS